MRYLILIPLLICSPASAQSLVDDAPGLYGSATDSANSCATNPHELSFQTRPPHVILTWSQTKDDGVGQPRTMERYDIEDYDATTLTLREEGDFRPDRAGGRIWIMQMMQNPSGYCWRRPDWPSTQCKDQQLRCEKPIS